MSLKRIDNWFAALNQLGIPTIRDPDAGLSAGGYFLPADIDPNRQTRSDARRSYYDPISSRTNLNVVANTHVTRILFKSGTTPLHATGVEVTTTNPLDKCG
jgi:choline dehydrogenase